MSDTGHLTMGDFDLKHLIQTCLNGIPQSHPNLAKRPKQQPSVLDMGAVYLDKGNPNKESVSVTNQHWCGGGGG